MSRMVLLNLNSCRKANEERGAQVCGSGQWWRGWATMGFHLILIISLVLFADTKQWPLTGDCQPCRCYYKMSSFGRLQAVNCSQRGIRFIPSNLPRDLTALDLSWNSLVVSELARSVCQFKSLKSLELSFDKLTSLSNILKECSSVLELNLTGNKLTRLDSQTFENLGHLRRLLGVEVESALPADVFRELKNLTDLDLLFHGHFLPIGLFDGLVLESLSLYLTESPSLPNELFGAGLATLSTLQITGERLLSVPSDLLHGLCALKKLFLVLPSVRKLPEHFFQHQSNASHCQSQLVEIEVIAVHSLSQNTFDLMPDLHRLQLKGIQSLPTDGFVSEKNLERLVITNSPLNSISACWFKDLSSLKTLKLSGVELENIHVKAFEGLVHLVNLDLSYNSLKNFTGTALQPFRNTLETLTLSGNFLSEITKDCFRDLRSLRFLDISDNQLVNIFPNSFSAMKNLSVLYLYRNRLTSLPNDLFKHQQQLRSLSVATNYFVEFPTAILALENSLERIDLSSNNIRTVPFRALCQFVYLNRVSLIANPLHCDCELLILQVCLNIAVKGQCETPGKYRDNYLSKLVVPDSCKDILVSNETTSTLSNDILPTVVRKQQKPRQSESDVNTESNSVRDGEKQNEEPQKGQNSLNQTISSTVSNISLGLDGENQNNTVIRSLFPLLNDTMETSSDDGNTIQRPSTYTTDGHISSESTSNQSDTRNQSTSSKAGLDNSIQKEHEIETGTDMLNASVQLDSDENMSTPASSSHSKLGNPLTPEKKEEENDSSGPNLKSVDAEQENDRRNSDVDSRLNAFTRLSLGKQSTSSRPDTGVTSDGKATVRQRPGNRTARRFFVEEKSDGGGGGSKLVGVIPAINARNTASPALTTSASIARAGGEDSPGSSGGSPAGEDGPQVPPPTLQSHPPVMSGDLQSHPPVMSGDLDSERPLNQQELNTSGVDASGNQATDKIAFNFTISALAALLLFALSLLAIYGIRRWQQKGTYIVANNPEVEMNSVDTTPEDASVLDDQDLDLSAKGDVSEGEDGTKVLSPPPLIKQYKFD